MAEDDGNGGATGSVDFGAVTGEMLRQLRQIEAEGEETQRWVDAYFERIGGISRERQAARDLPTATA